MPTTKTNSLKLVNYQYGSFTRVEKVTKATALARVEAGNRAKTMIWDYSKAGMYDSEDIIEVKSSIGNKFLRSAPDNHVGDNFSNLIDMSWYPIL